MRLQGGTSGLQTRLRGGEQKTSGLPIADAAQLSQSAVDSVSPASNALLLSYRASGPHVATGLLSFFRIPPCGMRPLHSPMPYSTRMAP
jgi:hypothetical protein